MIIHKNRFLKKALPACLFGFGMLAFSQFMIADRLGAEPENANAGQDSIPGSEALEMEMELDALKAGLFGGKFASEDEFQEALARAAKAGLPEQIRIEAKISRYWTQGQFEDLMALLPQMEKNLENWDYARSEIFTEKRELMGYYHLFRAYQAKVSGTSESFAGNAKESFWNFPELAEILALWIEEKRQEERMANLVMPMDAVLTTSQGEKTTLNELVTDKKGILIDFWATWCAPCIALMPELIHKAEKLEPQGIVVAGMNTETEERADTVRKARDIRFAWLVEPPGAPFQQLLRIDSIPRMVLVSPQGKVLYNGHPMDPALNEALSTLEVTL